MMHARRLLAWLLCLMMLHAASAAPATPEVSAPATVGISNRLERFVDAAVNRSLRRGDLPGCVVLIGRRDATILFKAYGKRAVEPTAIDMTTDTVFDMASITKPVATATSIMLLIERGQLRLDDRVAKYVPNFAHHGKEAVTIEQLLIHTAGLIPDNSVDDYREGWAAAEQRICELKPQQPPGTKFVYSDVGFLLLGRIVQVVTGKPVNEFARDEIFTPLGMSTTGYLPDPTLHGRIAPSERRDGEWLVGEVHDPRAALLGGVAGHAGLFSTANDLSRYARMMIGQGELDGVRILKAETVREMTTPRDTAGQKRGLGWDMGSEYSRNRGDFMSSRAFGHGGFTGTAMWIDPELELYVVFLSSRLHPNGQGQVNDLAGLIGTAASGLISSLPPAIEPTMPVAPVVKLGIDELAKSNFAALARQRVGLIANHTSVDSRGTPTANLLATAEGVKLVAIFSPEHGLQGVRDDDQIGDGIDSATGLPVYSLYGETRQPTAEQLAGVDTLVFDIQDIGARFYTYASTLALAMEAAAQHGKRVVVLDRPNPLGGVAMEGGGVDGGGESFVACHNLPLRHGLTLGEFARLVARERQLAVDLQVVPMVGWQRTQWLDETGLAWIHPSPNMRSLTAAVLYPGVGLLETTNVSVGRGTDRPFELFGAPWIDGRQLATALRDLKLPGLSVMATEFTPEASKFAGQRCQGVQFYVTDRAALQPVRLGLKLAETLRRLYPNDWDPERLPNLLTNHQAFEAVVAGQVDAYLSGVAAPFVREFRERARPVLLYR